MDAGRLQGLHEVLRAGSLRHRRGRPLPERELLHRPEPERRDRRFPARVSPPSGRGEDPSLRRNVHHAARRAAAPSWPSGPRAHGRPCKTATAQAARHKTRPGLDQKAVVKIADRERTPPRRRGRRPAPPSCGSRPTPNSADPHGAAAEKIAGSASPAGPVPSRCRQPPACWGPRRSTCPVTTIRASP